MPAPGNKGQRYDAAKSVLTAEEVGRLLQALGGESSRALRNKALIATIWRGALRVSEALALRPGDVDLARGEVYVRGGKGGKSRTVGVDDGAVKLLGRWVERRRSLGYSGHKPLFCSVKAEGGGGPLASAYVRRLLPALADRAGIDRRVHAHGLRHSRAKEMADAGIPVYQIRDALGHKSLATTDTYLQSVTLEHVAAMRSAGWTAP